MRTQDYVSSAALKPPFSPPLESPTILCASREYISRRGLPTRVEMLAQHDIIMVADPSSVARSRQRWVLSGDDGQASVKFFPKVVVGDLDTSMSLCLGGSGIAALPRWLAWPELASDRLRVLLNGLRLERLALGIAV